MRHSRLLSKLFLAIAVGLMWIPSAAQAATPTVQNIVISPSSTEVKVPPGGTSSNSLTVINGGGVTFDFSVTTAPYHVNGENYNPDFTPLPGKVDASGWVHISSPTRQSLISHASTDIKYSVDVPKNTASGGYYAVLFAETQPSAKSGVVSHNRVGNILYITVEGPVKTGGQLQPGSLPHISLASSLPLSMRISDTGGLHFLSTASITATDLFGKQIFKASLQRYVLPETVRKISVNWQNTPPIGLYKVQRSATVAGQTQHLADKWVFIIHPWVLLVFILIIVLVILTLRPGRKHHNRQ